MCPSTYGKHKWEGFRSSTFLKNKHIAPTGFMVNSEPADKQKNRRLAI